MNLSRAGASPTRSPRYALQCHTGGTLFYLPTNRRRHAITETPLVQAALDELRHELGTDRIELGELVVLGARMKLRNLQATRDQQAEHRQRLATRVRARRVGAEVTAAQSVRPSGWART